MEHATVRSAVRGARLPQPRVMRLHSHAGARVRERGAGNGSTFAREGCWERARVGGMGGMGGWHA